MTARSLTVYLFGSILGLRAPTAAQVPGTIPGTLPPNPSGYKIISPVTSPTLAPGQITLLELERRFAQEVAEDGGKAFASWFADDAVALNNGKPATLGRGAIALSATWDPKQYSLTWVAQGAQMGSSNDMGFTWGHYEGRATDKNRQAIVMTGRYITVWKKLPNGTWKVAMDASAQEPPDAGECCTLPKP